jgi:hypothetical protein
VKPLAERLVIALRQAFDNAIGEAALRRLLNPAAIIGGLDPAIQSPWLPPGEASCAWATTSSMMSLPV